MPGLSLLTSVPVSKTLAASAYLCRDCIFGVIASGAGFPQGLVPKSDLGFILFGTAGFEDFNFPEIRNLDEALAKAGLTHRVDFF